MKRVLKELIFVLKAIVFVPHYLLYIASESKQVIDDDVAAMCKTSHFSRRNKSRLIYLLANDKFFRKMFYTRIGSLASLVRWYAPGDNTFFPSKSIGGHLLGTSLCYYHQC